MDFSTQGLVISFYEIKSKGIAGGPTISFVLKKKRGGTNTITF